MERSTRFAWVMDESAPRSDALWDREILRTDRFLAMPSAGSLVAGWTLVVPKRPMLNLSILDEAERSELEGVIARVASALSGTGGAVYCFEHGSGWSGSATGCGVDQAHLHIVPLPFDLLTAVRARRDGTVEWQSEVKEVRPLGALPPEGEYVAIWSPNESRSMIGRVRNPISQWIRRVIADELGFADEWDYRRHPLSDKVQETLKILARLQTAPAR